MTDGFARYAVARVPSMIVWTAVLAVLLYSGTGLWTEYSRWMLERTPRSEVFTYESVEFVELSNTGLLMASTRSWHRDIDQVQWNDALMCEGERGPVVVSTYQTGAANIKAQSLHVQEWKYTAEIPDEGVCFIRATVVAEIDGKIWSQTLRSAPFDLSRAE